MPFISIKPNKDWVNIRMYITATDKWIDQSKSIETEKPKSLNEVMKNVKATGGELVEVQVKEDAFKMELLHWIILGSVALVLILCISIVCHGAIKQKKEIKDIEEK